jgi:phospholipid methyltransferase
MRTLLARWRVSIGFVFGALVLFLAEPTGSTLVAGSAIALVGECLRLWASGHLNKAREVTTSGPYRLFAHPLYVGSATMGVGLAVIANNFVVTIAIGLYLVTTLTAAIRSEEAFLRGKFGDRYDHYRRGGAADRADSERSRRFSLAQALANREQRALAGLALALLLLILKATYNGTLWRAAAGQ